MFSHTCPHKLRRTFAQLLAIVTLGLLIAISASAYTLVLRDGRRIEIPEEFILTRTTLTYEISPGFNQTLLMSLIDVRATERANGEPLGGFFTHRQEANNAAANNTTSTSQAARPA